MHKKTQSLNVQKPLLPPILTSFEYEDEYEDKIANKMTIKAFLREGDSKMFLSQKNAFSKNGHHNPTSQNSLLNEKSPKKLKGSLLVNELWSYSYYKKVIKFSKLEEGLNKLKKKNEVSFIEQKSALLRKKEDDFKHFNKEINSVNSLNPFAYRNLEDGNKRRNAVSRNENFLIEKKSTQMKNRQSLKLILKQQEKDIVFEKNKIKRLITSCDDYDKDTRLFERQINDRLMDSEKLIKLNNKQLKGNLQETISNYFEERKKKKEFNHHISLKSLKNNWNFDKYMDQMRYQEMIAEI